MAVISGEYLAAIRILVFIGVVAAIVSGLGSLLGLQYAYPVFQLAMAVLLTLLIFLAVKSGWAD